MAEIDRVTGLVGYSGVKVPVKAASTGVLVLSGEQTIDGIACVTGDRVLVMNQASSVDNGIYVVSTGAWTRAQDCDGSYDLRNGSCVFVFSGGVNGTTFFQCTTADTIVIGTSAITFAALNVSFTGTTKTRWCGTATGTANALVLTPTAPILAGDVVAGLTLYFKSSAAPNSAAATVAVSGLGAQSIKQNGAALVANAIQASQWYALVFDGANYELQTIGIPQVLVDVNGNAVITLSPTASAVNGIAVTNAATTGAPQIAPVGSDNNIGLTLATKGTGVLRFPDSTDSTKVMTLNMAGITTGNTRILSMLDASDTIVGVATAQTLTNKTLTSPIFGGTVTGTYILSGTVTIPASKVWSLSADWSFTSGNGSAGSVVLGLNDVNRDVCTIYAGNDGSGYNAANAVMKVRQATATARSINAAGTVNASGADYAEYERKRPDCGPIAKGAIVGFDEHGMLTDKWSLAVTFGVKSTNPSYVGGDVWGRAEDISPLDGKPIGEQPRPPEVPEILEFTMAEPLPPARPEFGTFTIPKPELEDPEEQAEALELWEAARKSYAEAVSAALARHMAHLAAHGKEHTAWAESKAELEVHNAKLTEEHAIAVPKHKQELEQWEARVEAARACVDRIAYAGKVPVNVTGAKVGDWIVPAQAGEGITGHVAATFEPNAIGRVRTILPDGRALIVIK